jgi:hypothetical protein
VRNRRRKCVNDSKTRKGMAYLKTERTERGRNREEGRGRESR